MFGSSCCQEIRHYMIDMKTMLICSIGVPEHHEYSREQYNEQSSSPYSIHER